MNIFAPPPPPPLDVVHYVKRERRGGGFPPPSELIPEYASASNAIIFYKQSAVKNVHTHRGNLSDIRLAWRGG